MEPVLNQPGFSPADKKKILQKLQEAALFEQFLNKKYLAVTRFSLEGGDALIPMLDALADFAGEQGCREIILGMAHRGRLNVQAHFLGKPYKEIFAEFENCYDPESLYGSGDVKYHNGYLSDIQTAGGKHLKIYMVHNPSHLEAVDGPAEGIARARQDMAGAGAFREVLPLLIHGDAAFAGEGVVYETLNMSRLPGFRTGGTIHIVLNNQIGYTTLPEDARSTRYATDGAKMLMVPIFHVHGENPEAAVHVMRLAAAYRMEFKKDAVVDLVCYRRWGHNEGDEPYYTQPQMVERIRKRPSLHRLYADALLESGTMTQDGVKSHEAAVTRFFEEAFDAVHGSVCPYPEPRYFQNWAGYHGGADPSPGDTGVGKEKLKALAARLSHTPKGFSIYPKLDALLKKRLETVDKESGIDWACAESLAFATLLTEGFPIRLSGQDVARGTFAQRHSVWADIHTGKFHVPLNHLEPDQARFDVFNSHLSEYGVLGFEYGYSVTRPETLTLWEAQFGDFSNNAQAVIDLFIAAGESKWGRLSGLVLLLPHGYEGLGPEHSSARMERFLQLCAEDNLQVCNATTPAQYFHLLRRQMKRKVRKPLVIFTPKSLLRHPLAVSDLPDMASGRFQEVLDDTLKPKPLKRIVLCSGKIYYELLQRRERLKKTDTALLRVEQFYPFPEAVFENVAAKYRHVKEWIWVQEEPRNMGGWAFMRDRLDGRLPRPLRYVGRPDSASPAPGFPKIYRRQQDAVVDEAVAPHSGE
jgi:2-oxoglutarate dehydrogenase E1 component